MIVDTLFPFRPAMVVDKTPRQGRSKKQLTPIVTYQGGVYIAQWGGRANTFFGRTPTEALKNLRGTE